MAETFLLYRPDPFGVGLSRYAIANRSDLRFVSPSEIAELSEDIFTYDTSTLIEDLRRNDASPPKAMIDLGDAIRLSTGISKADGGEAKWSFWRRIRRHFQSERNWKSFCALHESRSTTEKAGDDELFSELAKACNDLWRALRSELEAKDEIARFFEIEVPASRIFHQRQFQGIKIDVQHVNQCLQTASTEKYESYRVVADQIDISPTGLNYWNISEHLPALERSYIDDAATGYKLRDQLKMSADRSTFARSFTDFMDATRDVDVLTRLSSSEGITFPTFHSIGTISSRILVSDPHLQELRRKFRGVFSADEGFVLQYFDYSQFEPGIMASLSEDPVLVDLYNSGDVYSALSTALFGNEDYRNLCKKIFLAFSYGMTASGIAKLLSAGDPDSDLRAANERKVEMFFKQFARLTELKARLEDILQNTGKVGTALGNHRFRTVTGPLRARERRWATSQSIQGTASLIFKTAIIDINGVFGDQSILLPMHDAVLMQLPSEGDITARIDEVKKIMAAAFIKWCPLVQPRITNGAFN